MTPYTQLRASRPRLKPSEMLTLGAPLSVFVEPTNVCNFACPVCPESFPEFDKQAGYYGRMSPATWKRVLSELRTVKDLRVLRFWGIGEPTLNADLPRMISEAAGIAERTELATNGSLLALRAAGIINSGLHYLRVSVYSTTESGYEIESGSRYKLSGIVDNVREFRTVREALGSKTPWICAQFVSSHPEEAPAFERQWEGIADEARVEILHNWGGNDSRLVQLAKPKPEARKVCSKPFYELFIKANGDVSACCLEWDGSLKIGSIATQSLREIWRGERMREIRALHLSGRRSQLSMCRDCSFIQEQPDNMDSVMTETL
jgi:radical SAM protein with 4Fe4S-binding SPASM domain